MHSPEALKPRLLLVEDDIHLSYLLRENLEASGFSVHLAAKGSECLTALAGDRFELCIFDVMLPEEDGFSLARKLCSMHTGVPFLFLSARTQEQDRLRGFALGAEDYVLKPFSFKELLCRIHVVLRRNGTAVKVPETSTVMTMGGLSLHTEHRCISIGDSRRKLSQREAQLLQLLMERQGNYIPRREILERLWGRDDYFSAKSMDVFITRLRKLIREEPALLIENLYGTGYRIYLREEAGP